MSVFIKTASFAAPILLIMFVSMVASEALIGAGIVNRLEKIGEPLASFANLPGICGVVLVTAFGSPTAANIMLQDLRENRIITEKETLLASILNTTSVSIRETLTYHLPIVLPTLGLYVGLVYIGTFWLGTLILLLFVVISGKIFLRKREVYGVELEKAEVSTMIKRVIRRYMRILSIFLTTTFAVFTLTELGLIKKIEDLVVPLAKVLNLPPAIFPPLAAYITSPLIGFSMIGSLIHNSVITEREAIISLLFGSIFMLPFLYIRFYFPQWISIFGFRLGVLRGLISMTLVMITRVIVLLIFISI